MNRTDRVLIGVGAVAAAITGMGLFGFTLSGAIATIALGMIWGGLLGILRGWRG